MGSLAGKPLFLSGGSRGIGLAIAVRCRNHFGRLMAMGVTVPESHRERSWPELNTGAIKPKPIRWLFGVKRALAASFILNMVDWATYLTQSTIQLDENRLTW